MHAWNLQPFVTKSLMNAKLCTMISWIPAKNLWLDTLLFRKNTQSSQTQLQAQIRQEFESLLGPERSARTSELKSVDDAHRTELSNLEKNVQELQEVLHLNRAHIESKHYSFGLDADLRHKQLNQLINERFAVWEAKFCDVDPA